MSQNAAPRVLYVDDEAINQCIATEILLSLGTVPDTASDGLQALNRVRTGHYALVITDVEMPVMDGAVLTHILREDSRYAGLPILACTAISTEVEEKKLLEQGFSAVLRKPFDADALRGALARFAASGGDGTADEATDAAPPTPVTEGKDIRLPGFSVSDGLARVMGNVPLYISLLFDFRHELVNASADIRRFRRDGDMPSILAAVHKLKGVSGNVGATELYSHIVDTEPRLRGNAEAAEKHLDTLERYVTTTLAALTEAEKTLAVVAEPPRAGQAAEEEGPDIDKLRPALAETLRFVRQHDTAARDAFEEARPFLGASGKAEAFDIRQSLDSFDFDKAESSILHLARTLELELEESDALF